MAATVLPVTALALAPFTALHLFLALNTIYGRFKTRTFLGIEGRVKPEAKPKRQDFSTPITEFDPLMVARSAHGNFVENVPLALVLSAVIEINGGNPTTLGRMMAALVLTRTVHAIGILRNNRGRQFGFFANLFLMIGLASWAGSQGYAALF